MNYKGGIYKKNPKVYMKKHNKKWRLANKERNKENHKKWDTAHRKQNNERAKKYREKHKEQIAKYQKDRREDNKHYYQQYEEGRKYLSWRIAQRRYHGACRRVRKLNADGFHTIGEWELLKKQYSYICPSCGRKEPNIRLSEDHIIPLSKGGCDDIENIQPLCRDCNSRKHTKVHKFPLNGGKKGE